MKVYVASNDSVGLESVLLPLAHPCQNGQAVAYGGVCTFDTEPLGLASCDAIACGLGGQWNATSVNCVEQTCPWGQSALPALVPLPFAGDEANHIASSSCGVESSVASGTVCSNSVPGYSNCTTRTCVRGNLYPADPGSCDRRQVPCRGYCRDTCRARAVQPDRLCNRPKQPEDSSALF